MGTVFGPQSPPLKVWEAAVLFVLFALAALAVAFTYDNTSPPDISDPPGITVTGSG